MKNKIYPVRNNIPPLSGEDNRLGEFSQEIKHSAGFSNGAYLIIFLVLIVGLIGLMIWQGAKNSQASSELVAFAKCLTEKGWVMYGTDSCEWCQKQKADFKSAWQYIDYVNCISDPQRCVANNIESTPSWMSDGKQFVGYQTLEQLKAESGCPF